MFLVTGKLFFVRSGVKQKVSSTKHDLIEGLGCLEIISQCNFGVYHSIGKWFTCFVMFWYFFQDIFLPHPVFEHLTWHFDEILFNWGSSKSTELSFRAHVVHDMSKLMEEGDNLSMHK